MDWLTVPLAMPFMQTALAAAILIGVTNALLGVHVVKRRMAFVGDALAHTTLPGLAIAQIMGTSLSLGALAAAIVAALAIHFVSRRRVVAEDTAIGVVFTGLFALGVILASRARSYRDLSHVLFGNILGVTTNDLQLILGMTVAVMALLALLHKELELTAFDPTHAEAIGLKPDRTRLILLILLAFAVVSGIQAVGVILTSALLITPSAAAGLVTQSLLRMMLVACGITVLAAFTGLLASFHFEIASGAAIVLACTLFFAVAAVVRAIRLTVTPKEMP